MKNTFSDAWNRSTQRRKQRKYRMNAPLHIKQKFVHSHLSNELIKKYGTRNVQICSGDKVNILRGQFKGKSGKVEKVDIEKEKIQISGVEMIKKDGSTVPLKMHASNVIITELNLENKKRKKKITEKETSAKK